MKKRLVTKWPFVTLITLITICGISCVGVKYQIKHHSGGHTEVVDSSIFSTISSPLAITNVSVLSSDCSEMNDHLTVLIKDQKIEKIDTSVSIPKGYKRIDGTDKFLIPGLIDAHTHVYRSKNNLLLYLANGITHIANMSSLRDDSYLEWREDAENNALSPRIYIAAGGMSSKKGLMAKILVLFGNSPGYNTSSQVRKAVRDFKDKGYDAIKIYNLNREAYIALNDEAKKIGIPAVGHLPSGITLDDLYNSGQSQLAHVEEITKATMQEFGGLSSRNGEEYLAYLRQKSDSIAIKLKENNISVVSTIRYIENIPQRIFNLPNLLKSIELEYQNPGIIEGSKFQKGWLPGNNAYEDPNIADDPSRYEANKLFWKYYIEAIHIMTRALSKHEVSITAGTDSNGPHTIPGFSLHDELEALNNAGLTNAQVLHSATQSPSKWMNTDAGKIEVGLKANLILLDKNPLESIQNTRSINAVINKGELLDRALLNQMLQSVKDANNRSREVSIDEFID